MQLRLNVRRCDRVCPHFCNGSMRNNSSKAETKISRNVRGESESATPVPRALTQNCEREDHVLHDFIADHAAHALWCVGSGFQMALVHSDLHLLYLLHSVGTENIGEEGTSIIDAHARCTTISWFLLKNNNLCFQVKFIYLLDGEYSSVWFAFRRLRPLESLNTEPPNAAHVGYDFKLGSDSPKSL